MFSECRASASPAIGVTCFIASTTVLPSFVGCTVQNAVGTEGAGDARDAGLEARVAAEQVYRHRAAVGEQAVAGAVEGGAVEHRARRLVVVEVDAEHVDRAGALRVGDEARASICSIECPTRPAA